MNKDRYSYQTLLYTKIYNKYVNELYSYGKSLGVSHEDMEDLIHDVFFNIIARHDKIDLESNHVKFFLFRCLKNKFISNKRKEKDIRSLTFEDSEDYNFSLEITSIDALIVQEEELELKIRVDKILKSLTNRQREAIYLRYMQELSYEEIAEMLNVTEKGARKLISRAMSRVREEQLSLVVFLSFVTKFYSSDMF